MFDQSEPKHPQLVEVVKRIVFAALVLIGIAALLAGISFRFSHPEMTETQLFLDGAPILYGAIAGVCGLVASLLWVDISEGD